MALDIQKDKNDMTEMLERAKQLYAENFVVEAGKKIGDIFSVIVDDLSEIAGVEAEQGDDSYITKIDLMKECGFIGKDEAEKLTKFRKIRNNFAGCMLWKQYSFTCQDKRLHNLLTLIFCRGDTKLFLEDHREVTLGTETAHIGNLRHGMLSAFQQFSSTVELIGTEEVRGCLTCQTFDLIVELRT